MKLMKHNFFLYTFIMSIIALTSCDDGLIEEKTSTPTTTDTYTLQITGKIEGTDTWSGSYTVALACFDEGNEYAVIAKSLSSGTNDTITLKGVPSTATTAEIAVISPLRERIATLYSYDIPADASKEDTLKIHMTEKLNASMFAAINKQLFQGNNCSRCHQGASPAAQLDLTTENAYSHIVNVPAHKQPDMMRIAPGDAEHSFLYKVITDPSVQLSYSHTGLFTDPVPQAFQQIMKSWIDSGAKE